MPEQHFKLAACGAITLSQNRVPKAGKGVTWRVLGPQQVVANLDLHKNDCTQQSKITSEKCEQKPEPETELGNLQWVGEWNPSLRGPAENMDGWPGRKGPWAWENSAGEWGWYGTGRLVWNQSLRAGVGSWGFCSGPTPVLWEPWWSPWSLLEPYCGSVPVRGKLRNGMSRLMQLARISWGMEVMGSD